MANITVNTDEVINSLKEANQQIHNSLKDGITKVCLLIERESKERCPSGDDGMLRASLTYDVEEEKDRLVGYVGSNLDYAPYIHQGTGIYALEGNGRKEVPWVYYNLKNGEFYKTSGIKPTPFIQLAVDFNRNTITDYLKGCMGG